MWVCPPRRSTQRQATVPWPASTLNTFSLSELLDRYGESISRKIVLMIAWFNPLSRFLNGCRVPLETTDKIGTATSPLGGSSDQAA